MTFVFRAICVKSFFLVFELMTFLEINLCSSLFVGSNLIAVVQNEDSVKTDG